MSGTDPSYGAICYARPRRCPVLTECRANAVSSTDISTSYAHRSYRATQCNTMSGADLAYRVTHGLGDVRY
eukprot:100234-Rhodomonas_salina.1